MQHLAGKDGVTRDPLPPKRRWDPENGEFLFLELRWIMGKLL